MGDSEKKPKKGLGIITGLIVGGAIGSVASLMFAPAKGTKTRKKLRKKGEKLFDEGKSKAEEFLDKYSE